jgi:hypothetical protein
MKTPIKCRSYLSGFKFSRDGQRGISRRLHFLGCFPEVLDMHRYASLILVSLFALAGCETVSTVYVTLSSPATQTVDAGQSITVTANVIHASDNAGVSWTLTGPGALTSQTATGVVYMAPSTVTGGTTATLSAVPVKNTLFVASTQINVVPAPVITSTSLPGAVLNMAYSEVLNVSGGVAPYTWSLAGGSLPAGLSLSSGGTISGTPTSTGNSSFTVKVTDSATSPFAVTATFNLVVTNGVRFQGVVYSGQQPLSAAAVQLYAEGTTGYGSAATPLLTTAITTGLDGGFNFVINACPPNSLVYLTAAGGKPASGGNNSAIALLAALGPCANISGTSAIHVNEVTTVAAVWAMQQFAGSTWSALSNNATTASDTFGTSATNLQGLSNAMAMAGILSNTATGASPGSDTSGNQYNVEDWQINTIADMLAACDASAVACSTLFTNTTEGGNTPTDTIQVALNMARYPTAKISGLTGLVNSTSPFQPMNTSTNDLTIGLSYSTGSSDSRWIAFDQFGNAWITTSGSSVIEMDPSGNTISSPTSYMRNGGSSTSIGTSYEVAVDTANNAWFTDETNDAIFEVLGSKSAGGANGGAGTALSTSSVSTGSVESIVVDGDNNVWAAISGSHVVGLLNGSTSLVTGGPVTTNPFGMAVDLSNQSVSGNVRISGGGSLLYAINSGGCSTNITVNGKTGQIGGSIAMDFTEALTISSTSYTAGAATPLNYIVDTACNNTTNAPNNSSYGTPRVFMSTPYGIAFDNSNNMWVVNQNYTSTTDNTSGQYSLSKLAAQNYGNNAAFTGAAAEAKFTFTSITGGGLAAPFYIAMDGASAAWVANSTGAGGVSAFANDGTAISSSTGFYGGTYNNGTTTYQRSFKSPRGIAVDGSGNVWVANTAATYVTVMVGAAMPTVTPLSVGIKNGTLASKP